MCYLKLWENNIFFFPKIDFRTYDFNMEPQKKKKKKKRRLNRCK